jgi:hypothetical protein
MCVTQPDALRALRAGGPASKAFGSEAAALTVSLGDNVAGLV